MTPSDPAFSPDAVLFDCDGTLLLTAELHFEALHEAIRRQGGEMPRAWYMAVTGLGRQDTFRQFAQDFGLSFDLPRLVSESIALTVGLSDRVRVNAPVADLARGLAGRVPIAVVTNSEAAIADAFLRAAGLTAVFNAVLTVESAPRPKPAPDLYLAAAARLGADIARCLVLEDSTQGLAAARAAGAACIDVREPDWALQAAPYLAACADTGQERRRADAT